MDAPFVRWLIGGVETDHGPWWEPDRPRPAVSLEEARSRTGEFEDLLVRLASWRAKTLLGCVAIGCAAGGLVGVLVLAARGSLAGFLAFPVMSLAAVAEWWAGWQMWTQGGAESPVTGDPAWPVMGGVSWSRLGWGMALFLASNARVPSRSSVAKAAETFYDTIVGLNAEPRPHFLGGLSTQGYPLVAAVARSSWSMIPSSHKDELG